MHPRLTSGFERLAIGDPDASDWKSSGFERRVCSQLETALHHSQSPGASPRSSWSAASTRAQVLQRGRSWFAASSSACAHLGGAWHLSHHGFAAIPDDPGRRRRDPHRPSAEQTSARSSRRPLHWFSMWLLPRRPSKVVVLCVSCLRLSACDHVARVLWECAVACRRREVKSATAAPAREENTESPEPLAMANSNSIGQSAV